MLFPYLALSAVTAATVSASTINFDNYDCPKDWSVSSINDDYWCCFGAGHITNDDGYCCVSNFSSSGNIDPDDEIKSDCFPFCDDDSRKRAPSTDQCAEKIPFSASDYSKRVSAASKSVMSNASGTATDSPATTTADATSSSDDSDSVTSTGGGSDGASETGDSADETNSDNAVGPLPTGDALAKLGGAVAAAALLAL